MRQAKKTYQSNFVENIPLEVYDLNESEVFNSLNDTTENSSFNTTKEITAMKSFDLFNISKNAKFKEVNAKPKQILGENLSILNK